MFSINTFAINQSIREIVKVPAEQGRIVAIAVAKAIAAKAMLPSAPIEAAGVPEYYANSIKPFVTEIISAIGEGTTFGMKSSAELASVFWKMRYNAVHPEQAFNQSYLFFASLEGIKALANYDIETIMAGGHILLPKETYEFMNKYRSEIVRLTAVLLSEVKLESANDNAV